MTADHHNQLTEDLLDFLAKFDFEEMARKEREVMEHRRNNPDWDRPVVMYGVRKQGHKCIKKPEIGVIIDCNPWQDRARTAETHWYNILYKRLASDAEYADGKGSSRRYIIWHYFIDKRMTIDRIVSMIVQDDRERFGIADTSSIVSAFEGYFGRNIRIYDTTHPTQQQLFAI